ncbi:MAG TPA: hypothetical protein DF698_04330 [Candidatus Atribacteria bacterium]|nr:hypothetical protein [Candidatus Atribacteria bacterium]
MRNLFFIGLLILFLLLGCANNTPSPTSVPLIITEVNPVCGVAGETIIITGTSFGDTQGSSVVTFNGVSAVVTSWSNTQVSALVPQAAITGDIVVRVSGANSNGIRFTIPCFGPMQGMIVDQF